MSLELEILAPDRLIVRTPIVALQAADASGRFGLRTGHEDFLTVLVPCVVRYQTAEGQERFAAVDGGVLVLEGGRIALVTRDAVVAERLDRVADAAAAMLEGRRLRERTARAEFAELQTSLLHELGEVQRRT